MTKLKNGLKKKRKNTTSEKQKKKSKYELQMKLHNSFCFNNKHISQLFYFFFTVV